MLDLSSSDEEVTGLNADVTERDLHARNEPQSWRQFLSLQLTKAH